MGIESAPFGVGEPAAKEILAIKLNSIKFYMLPSDLSGDFVGFDDRNFKPGRLIQALMKGAQRSSGDMIDRIVLEGMMERINGYNGNAPENVLAAGRPPVLQEVHHGTGQFLLPITHP